MTYRIYDNNMEFLCEVGGKAVMCRTEGCENFGAPIEVADHPSVIVQCGPCQQWIIAPAPASAE